ncbi:hypothetical protein ABZX98_05595 [Streptomyces sp. NPDC002992]|uniref:hypothetical protein n=1 Tax=Streptomyces sp. NPDC002992 TaxID=3154273 RepID=UPI0033BBA17E
MTGRFNPVLEREEFLSRDHLPVQLDLGRLGRRHPQILDSLASSRFPRLQQSQKNQTITFG